MRHYGDVVTVIFVQNKICHPLRLKKDRNIYKNIKHSCTFVDLLHLCVSDSLLWRHWPIVTSPKSSLMSRLGLIDLRYPALVSFTPGVRDNTVSPTVLSLTWESPYMGKRVFILRRGQVTIITHFALYLCRGHRVMSTVYRPTGTTYPITDSAIMVSADWGQALWNIQCGCPFPHMGPKWNCTLDNIGPHYIIINYQFKGLRPVL